MQEKQGRNSLKRKYIWSKMAKSDVARAEGQQSSKQTALDLHRKHAIQSHVTMRELPHRPVTLQARLPSTANEVDWSGSEQSRGNVATFTRMITLQEKACFLVQCLTGRTAANSNVPVTCESVSHDAWLDNGS